MSNILKIDFQKLSLGKRQRGSSILGLALDGSRLDGVVLRRTNGSVQLQQTFSATLSLDPLTADPVLVGREIRNQLEAAGVRERRCIVALPLQWALTAHTKLPELAEADVPDFIKIEAERGFPCDVATLVVGNSRLKTSAGEQHAMLVGVPRNHIALLEQVLRAAQLRPVSFSLGLTALQPAEADSSNGVLALAIGENRVGLQVSCGGGIAALRTLEGALETGNGQRKLHTDVLVRETRITLAQLAPEIRAAVRRVRIFGPRELAQQLADEIDLRLEALDLKVELVSSYQPQEFGVELPPGVAVSPAFSLAAGYLAGREQKMEFLPPKVTAWQQFAAKYSTGKFQRIGLAAGAAAVLAGGAFLIQQIQLWQVQAQWNGMKKTYKDIQDMTAKINQYRLWFDEPVRGLTILRALTQAFPEDGSVTAKTVEIRDLNAVTCTGVARDYQSLLRTVEQLRKQIPDVNLGQTRGQPPSIQFTFTFLWTEGASHAN
jgi:hypothetical protein